MNKPDATATVFGGTGFLGSHIATCLAENGWAVRVAVRHPARVSAGAGIDAVHADVHDDASVADAVAGATAVVNAVSLYVEKGKEAPTFRSVHEEGAARVARLSAKAGAGRVFHVSGIGADTDSPSRFVRARGRGEENVRAAFPDATVLRPSVMFGIGDSFFNSLAGIVRYSPVVPVIGARTRLQPVHAGDVAMLVERLLRRDRRRGEVLELGGPDIMTMGEIVAWLCRLMETRRMLVPVPPPIARLQARLLAVLPNPPLTVDQVELLGEDNVVSGESGFHGTGIEPVPMADIVPHYIGRGGKTDGPAARNVETGSG